MTGRETNWAGNISYAAESIHRPATLDALRRTVAGSRKVRALGTRHSFNRLADTSGDLVDVTGLPVTIDVDTDRHRVRVSGGTRYGELATYLHGHGLALHNLGSLPHISVAGACATATHGSGDGNGCLATAVSALEIVTADGDLGEVSRASDPEAFAGMVVSLGALGVVTSLTLDVQPTFEVRQHVYDRLPLGTLAGNIDEIFSAAYSVSAFTTWQHEVMDQVWLKRRGTDGNDPPPELLGAVPADGPRHPVPGMPAANCTEQGGVPGPWHQRLPHFRLEHMPSAGDELQSEYLVARDDAVDAIAVLAGLRDLVAPVLRVCELRTVAADDLWLSPAYRRDSLAFHFTWLPDDQAVLPVLAAIEAGLAPFDARPHWGKVFTTPPEVVRGLYERTPEFTALMCRFDPSGTFRNALLDEYLPA